MNITSAEYELTTVPLVKQNKLILYVYFAWVIISENFLKQSIVSERFRNYRIVQLIRINLGQTECHQGFVAEE